MKILDKIINEMEELFLTCVFLYLAVFIFVFVIPLILISKKGKERIRYWLNDDFSDMYV